MNGEEIINPGAVPESPSFKDYRFEFVAGAEPLPEEYSLRDKIFWIKNQRSSSCVAQSFSYYAELLNLLETGEKIKLSARDIYSVICLPQGGAYLRSGAQKVKDSGVVLEEDAPSYLAGRIPLAELEMRKRDDITEEEIKRGKTFLARSYVRIPEKSFESLKRAIYEYHGAVTGIIGDTKSWFWDVGKDGIVDLPKKREFGHAIFCVGWKKINGKEYIEFVNSFGPDWGDNGFGYLPKEYFDKNLVFNPWTLIDMPNEYYPTVLKTVGVLKRLIVAIRVLLEKLTKRSLIKT